MEAGGVTSQRGHRMLIMVVVVVIVTVTATGTATKTGKAVITRGPTTVIATAGTANIMAATTALTLSSHARATTTMVGMAQGRTLTAGARNTEAAARAMTSPTNDIGTEHCDA
jgi:hypothetical protein